jgi:SAM-dependent methyltransferase
MSASCAFGRYGLVVALCLSLYAGGCSKKGSHQTAQTPSTLIGKSPGAMRVSGSSMPVASTSPANTTSLPSIECPLHKAGVDPQHLKPFADVEKYVAFLERPDRAAWQKPDEIVRALRLAGDETIADVGAGSGYFTFRFAAALPRGHVVATDIEAEMIRHIHHKAMTEGITNVEPVLAPAGDPKVPATADIVFLCDVLHHVQDRRAWLGRLHEEMKAGARLVLVEFKEGDLPEGPPASLKIPLDQLLGLVRGSGFAFIREEKDLLPYQTFLVFRKGGDWESNAWARP